MPPLPFVPAERVGEPIVMLFCMWLGAGDDPAGEAALGDLISLGEPVATGAAVVPFGLGHRRVPRLPARAGPAGLGRVRPGAHAARAPLGAQRQGRVLLRERAACRTPRRPRSRTRGCFEIDVADAFALWRFAASEAWLATADDQREHVREQDGFPRRAAPLHATTAR